MRKQGFGLLLALAALLLVAGLVWVWGANTAVIQADESGALGYLPAVFRPENTPTPTITVSPVPTTEPTPEGTPEPTETPEPTPAPAFANGGFEEGWTDVDGDKQQPNGWQLTWVQPGQPLYDSSDLATGTCECVHKFGGPNVQNPNLPPNEWLGGPDALILDGIHTYKPFRADTAWGAQLSQQFTLPPGSRWELIAPVQLHTDPRGSGFDAESSVWVNGEGAWAHIADDGMVDHEWCKHEQTFTVPGDGQVQIDIRFKVKYLLTYSFFIDGVRLQQEGSPDPYPDFPRCVPEDEPLETYRPYQE